MPLSPVTRTVDIAQDEAGFSYPTMPSSDDVAIKAFQAEARFLFRADQLARELIPRLLQDPPKLPAVAELLVIAQALQRSVAIASEYHVGAADLVP